MSIADDVALLRRVGHAWLNDTELMALERVLYAAQVAQKESGTVYIEVAGGGIWREADAVLSFVAPRNAGEASIPHYIVRHTHNGESLFYDVRTEAQMRLSPPEFIGGVVQKSGIR